MGADNLEIVWVVDVECTCWETREEQNGSPNEIIEIGMCGLSVQTGEIVHPKSFVVKPRFTEVSPFCTQLTGWTQEEIDAGLDIEDALENIKKELPIKKDDIWFSCGEFDRKKLTGTAPGSLFWLYKIQRWDNPFDLLRTHFNIKTLFALKHKLFKEKDMAQMLQHLGLPLEGTHHRGLDDALNIAKIVREVLK